MKIQGVDSLIINKVQEQTQKPIIQEVQKTKVENRYEDQVENRYEKQEENNKQQYAQKPDKILDKAIKQLNQTAEALNVELKFIINQDSGRVVVKVIDKTHDKVIREIPPEKTVDLVAQMKKALGWFVDERV